MCQALGADQGFLKKLPALPICAGSGSLRWRMAMTALATACEVMSPIPCAASSARMSP